MGQWKSTSIDKILKMIRTYCPADSFRIGIGKNRRLYIAPNTHAFDKNIELMAEDTDIDKVLLYIRAGNFQTGQIFIWAGEQFSTHIFEEEDLTKMMAEVVEENEHLKNETDVLRKQISAIRAKFGEEEADMQYLIAEVEKLKDENAKLDRELELKINDLHTLTGKIGGIQEKNESLSELLIETDSVLQHMYVAKQGNVKALPENTVDRIRAMVQFIKDRISS